MKADIFTARQRTWSTLRRSNRIQTRTIQHGSTSSWHEVNRTVGWRSIQTPPKRTRRINRDSKTWKSTHRTDDRGWHTARWSCHCRTSRSAHTSVARHFASTKNSTARIDWSVFTTLSNINFDRFFREGIKQRAKLIQQKCEVLLVNIHRNASQVQLPERVRFEYIQYLSKRFDEEVESEKALQHLYDRIERMQYTFHQKAGKVIKKYPLAWETVRFWNARLNELSLR